MQRVLGRALSAQPGLSALALRCVDGPAGHWPMDFDRDRRHGHSSAIFCDILILQTHRVVYTILGLVLWPAEAQDILLHAMPLRAVATP